MARQGLLWLRRGSPTAELCGPFDRAFSLCCLGLLLMAGMLVGCNKKNDMKPMPIFVTPFYSSQGPQISVGVFSQRLAAADAATIKDVTQDMKKQWDALPVEAMYVASIRLYDLGHKDDAVYWFYSAQYRARLFAAIVPDASPANGGSAFEAESAHASFQQLAGDYINGYAFGDIPKLRSAIEQVLGDNDQGLPDFTRIYPGVTFISSQGWADKRKETATGLSQFVDWIDQHAEEIKARRKASGLEGKY
jgi:hypothetical protein